MAGYYAGKWRSDAWFEDGGANDEGYYYTQCHICGYKTEHERGGYCIPCTDRTIRRNAGIRKVVVSGSSGNHTVKIYPNGKKYCDCKGFKFRKKCSHTAKAV